MTREEIIRMARASGIYTDNMLGSAVVGGAQINRFAALVAAAEREACAKVAEAEVTMEGYEKEIAIAIRARGEA